MISVEQMDEARRIIIAGGGRARLSKFTSARYGCVHWRVAQKMTARAPAELQIEEEGGSRFIRQRYVPQARTRPDRVIDMTGGVRWAQIVTPGGIINIHTGLVTALGGLPAVTTEISPSTREMPTSGDGGHWETEVRDFYLDRTDVTMIRRESI